MKLTQKKCRIRLPRMKSANALLGDSVSADMKGREWGKEYAKTVVRENQMKNVETRVSRDFFPASCTFT